MKKTFEFWCSTYGGGCGGYFVVRMRTSFDGDYTLVCPNCKHEHNRIIRNGAISGDRCNFSHDKVRIWVPKSAFSHQSIIEGRSAPSYDSESAVEVDRDHASLEPFMCLGNLIKSRFAGREQ